MKAVMRQLQWIKEKRTITAIARESEIPYTTLYEFDKGRRSLPTQYENQLRNFYSREVNSRLRDSGLSLIQRTRFRYYPPETVSQVERDMLTVQDRMTNKRMERSSRWVREGNSLVWKAPRTEEFYRGIVREIMQSLKYTYEEYKDGNWQSP